MCFQRVIEAAGEEMGYPTSLYEEMAKDCTFRNERAFDGFGKARPLVLANRGSQRKSHYNEKIGIYYNLGRCGLKVRHLWVLMLAFARDARNGIRERPTPPEILEKRAAEIGCGYRNSDDFITEME